MERTTPYIGRKNENSSFALTLVLLIFSIYATSANAAIVCTGKLKRVAMSPGGTVQVDYGYGVHYLCRFTESYGGFSPDTCKAMYSTLLTAFAAKHEVSFYFDSNGYASCADLPNWSALSPAPYHIALLEQQ